MPVSVKTIADTSPICAFGTYTDHCEGELGRVTKISILAILNL